MPLERIVAVGLLTRRDLNILGPTFDRTWPVEEAPSFSEVRAIFAAKCLACHGNDPKELKGDYDLRTRDAALLR